MCPAVHVQIDATILLAVIILSFSLFKGLWHGPRQVIMTGYSPSLTKDVKS